jgi:hypothetical protein
MSSKKKKSSSNLTGSAVPTVSEYVKAIPTATILSKPIQEVAVSPENRKKVTATRPKITGQVAGDNPLLKMPNEAGGREYLTRHAWPKGLQEALIKSCKKIAIRYVITDDSGSMMTNDGHRLVGVGSKNTKMIQCTRWSELTSSLKFHAELAQAALAPTEFRLLNNCEPIMVGAPDDVDGVGLQAALTVRDPVFFFFSSMACTRSPIYSIPPSLSLLDYPSNLVNDNRLTYMQIPTSLHMKTHVT